jgi:ureidoacrylate peracid hydrolase
MHQVRLSAEFRAEIKARRGGREYLFDRLDPRSTALLVIDMQNVFLAPGAPLEVPLARGIVGNINRLAAHARALGAPVVWLRSTFSDRGRGSWPLYFSCIAPGADGVSLRACFKPGTDGHRLWHELERVDQDLIIDKDRFSAFVEGASDAERRLVDLGIDTLIICGTLTNVCCESTMRDAMMRDFKCVMVEDANAALNEEDHLASLRNAARTFGDVMTTAELIGRFGPAEESRRAP